jgi:hypothetical protein
MSTITSQRITTRNLGQRIESPMPAMARFRYCGCLIYEYRPLRTAPFLRNLWQYTCKAQMKNNVRPPTKRTEPITRIDFKNPSGGTIICGRKKALSHFVAGYYK